MSMKLLNPLQSLLALSALPKPSPDRIQGWRDMMLWLVDNERYMGTSEFPDAVSDWNVVGRPQAAEITKTPHGFAIETRLWDGPLFVTGMLLARGPQVIAVWHRACRVELLPGDTITCEGMRIEVFSS